MTITGCARTILLLAGLLVLTGQPGCGSIQHQPRLSETPIDQMETIGVLVKSPAKQVALQAPRTGWVANAGRGAGLGSVLGGYGVYCNYGMFICVPALTVVGAMSGAVYGAAASEPASMWREAESVFRTTLEEVTIHDVALNHLVAIAKEHGYHIKLFPEHTLRDHDQDSHYRALTNEGISLVLELSELAIELRPAIFDVNPPRRLVMSARVRMIRTTDGTVFNERDITDDMGGTWSIAAWSDQNATVFRKEVGQAAQRLTEQIVEELFSLYSIPETTESHLVGEPIQFLGLKPFYPPIPNTNEIAEAKSLQPRLRWQSVVAKAVTYELKIWRAEGVNVRELIYSRQGLLQASHHLETMLQPSTTYYWTVRARFILNGRTRVTQWGTWRPLLAASNELYYRFKTPGLRGPTN